MGIARVDHAGLRLRKNLPSIGVNQLALGTVHMANTAKNGPWQSPPNRNTEWHLTLSVADRRWSTVTPAG